MPLAAPFGKPTLAESASIVLWKASPDASFLVRLERIQKTFLPHAATRADGGRLVDHAYRRSGGSDREKGVRVRIAARGDLSPIGDGEHVGVS